MTLRARIAAAAGLAVAIAVLVAAVGLYLGARSELRTEIDRSLSQRAATFAPAPQPSSPGEGSDGESQSGAAQNGTGQSEAGQNGAGQSDAGHSGTPPHASHPPASPPPSAGLPGPGDLQEGFPSRVQPVPFGGASGYVQFIAPNGTVHVPAGQGSNRSIPISARDRQIAREGSGRAFTDRTVRGTSLRVLTIGTGARGAVLVARPLTELDRELGRVLLILAIVAVAGIAIAAALGAAVARAALAPIARFTTRTEALADRLDVSERLPVAGRDELARLAASFNATLDALERSVAAQRNLVADASHELRTPIASLRANIQILGEADRLPPDEQQGLRADILSELDELTRLVGDVVELARGSEPRGATVEVALEQTVAEAIERAERRPAGACFTTKLEPALVSGDARRIERAIANLLDNACKWSPSGQPIEVELRDGVVSVRDHGPGFIEADLPHVFERFYRADSARKLPGSGLGLAIVRQAAEAHGGWVKAQNAAGGGALVSVSFGAPITSHAPPSTDDRRSSAATSRR